MINFTIEIYNVVAAEEQQLFVLHLFVSLPHFLTYRIYHLLSAKLYPNKITK